MRPRAPRVVATGAASGSARRGLPGPLRTRRPRRRPRSRRGARRSRWSSTRRSEVGLEPGEENLMALKEYAHPRARGLLRSAPRENGAYRNAATRLEAWVAGSGVYTYGTYPDIEATTAPFGPRMSCT